MPYHLYHITPRTRLELISRQGFRAVRGKSYHSETVKLRLKALPVVSLVARPVATLFSGTRYAVVADRSGRPAGAEAHADAG